MANPMFNPDMLKLAGARRALAVLAFAALVEALLIIGMALGVSRGVVVLWEGGGLEAALPHVVTFFVAYLLRQIVTWLRERGLDRFARRSVRDLRRSLAEHLYDAGPMTVSDHGSGAVTTMLVDGIDKVRAYLATGMAKSINLVVIPIVLIIALFFFDVVSAIIALVALPVVFGFMAMLGVNARNAAAAQYGEYTRLSNHFADALSGITTLKSFGRAEGYAKRVYEQSERLRKATVRTLRTATLSSLVLDLVRTFAVAAVAIMLGFRLMAGSIELAPALVALVVLPEYFAVVRAFAGDFHTTLDGTNQLSGIMHLLDEPVEVPEDPGLSTWGPHSALELSDVACAYADGDAVHTALSGIDLALEGCTTVGLVGTSGAGKSTLARMLAGFSSPSAGSVTVDGTELESLAVPSWRAQVGYIPQSPHVFDASLVDNIAFYHPDAAEDEIAQAAELAGLAELIAELPEGLNTMIGAGGRILSGGQAQRVALARALVGGGRPVLVLDEPTAHLDIETELSLKETMLPLFEGRLVIMATHRLHWMRSMDTLIVLDGGGVSQVGSYDELIAQDGPFASLVRELGGDA